MQQLTMFGVRGERVRVRTPRTARRDGGHYQDGRGRHADSLAAHGALSPAALTGRRAQIVAWLHGHGRPATDREIAQGLFGEGADMNMVRPRISELLDAGALREAGTARDAATGMTVRLVAVKGGA